MSDYDDYEEEEFEGSVSRQTFWRIIGLAKPQWKWMVGFLVTISMVSLLDSVFTFISKQIIDEAILVNDTARLYELVTIYGALIVVQAGMVFGFIFMAGRIGEFVQYDLRQKMFQKLQSLTLSYYDKTPVGWLMSRVTSDSQRIGELVSWGVLDTVWGITNIGSALIFMFFINWRLSLWVMLIVPVLLIVAAQFKRYILKEYRAVRRLNSKITGAYNENIDGVRVTKALVREERNLQEFQGLTTDMYRAGFRAAWLSALFLPIVQLISAVAIGGVVLYTGSRTTVGGMTIGSVQAFVSYITFMLWPIQEMARVYAEMQRAVASAERVFSLLDSEPEIVDAADAIDVETVQGEIRFENVQFWYEPAKPVIHDLDLTIAPGETIALVGPTGGGKSTIVNLLARFYEPKAGRIMINGQNYMELTQQTLQSKLGIVLQTPHLFSGSIRDNIRYGRLDATDADVIAAAKLTGAHIFIENLDKGYDEQVGEGGVLLSVGQKQLLSLARAVLAQPDIFIMDEATSSVDTVTEALIQGAMDTVLEQATSFVIAHRLSTIKSADRIMVVEEGRVTEIGSHEDLLQQKGHYYRLYARQFKQESNALAQAVAA